MSPFLTNKLRTLAPLSVLMLLAACATTPPAPVVDFKPGYDFGAVRKIAFYDESGVVTGNHPLPLSDMERDRIDSALEQALRARGFEILERKDAGQAQLLISWTLITNDKTDVRTYETPGMGVGYGRYGRYNRYSMYNCWGCGQTEVSVSNYTEGTFIVDMIDPKLQRSVWRGSIQSRLKGQLQNDQDKYNATADNIFASFPPP
jgi:hypothetical protein